MIDILNRLNKSKGKLNRQIALSEEKLQDKIEFEFCIEYQSGDGFCVVDLENNGNAPLALCINHLRENKTLKYDDYINLTIA